jgi:hypothetical protein
VSIKSSNARVPALDLGVWAVLQNDVHDAAGEIRLQVTHGAAGNIGVVWTSFCMRG